MRQRRTAASGPAVADGLALAEVLDSSAPLVCSVCCSRGLAQLAGGDGAVGRAAD